MKLTRSWLNIDTILKQHRYVMPIHIHRLPDLLLWLSTKMCPINVNIKYVHVFVTARPRQGTIKIREESIFPPWRCASLYSWKTTKTGVDGHVVTSAMAGGQTWLHKMGIFTTWPHAVNWACKLKYFSPEEVTGQDCSEQAMARAAEKAIDPQLLLIGSMLLTGLIVGFFLLGDS